MASENYARVYAINGGGDEQLTRWTELYKLLQFSESGSKARRKTCLCPFALSSFIVHKAKGIIRPSNSEESLCV